MSFWDQQTLPVHIYYPASIGRVFYSNRFLTIGKMSDLNVYNRALLKELKSAAPDFDDYTVPAVTINAGTPSMVAEAKEFGETLKALEENFHLTPDCELTYRLDPELFQTIEEGIRLKFAHPGRVEIRMLSTSDEVLSAMRYPHRGRNTAATVGRLREDGIKDISAVLLLCPPLDTPETFAKTLEDAIALDFSEISFELFDPKDPAMVSDLYEMEKRAFLSRFMKEAEGATAAGSAAHGEGLYPHRAEAAERLSQAREILEAAGYHCQNPLLYTKAEQPSLTTRLRYENPNYLGMGAGAYTFMDGSGYRNREDLTIYQRHCEEFEKVTQDFYVLEGKALAEREIETRLASPEGLSESTLAALDQEYPDLAGAAALAAKLASGLVSLEDGIYRVTAKGCLEK